MRVCKTCGVEKSEDAFYRDRTRLRRTCKDCTKSGFRTKRQECPTTAFRNSRNARYRREYGLTFDQVVEMWDDQGQRCAICGDECPGMSFHVDHDHLTGRVRALLCRFCNATLGNAKDDPDRLLACAAYIINHSAETAKEVSQ